MKRLLICIGLLFFVFTKAKPQSINDTKFQEIELSLENMFYGNDNHDLSRLFWLNEDEIISIRYKDSRPKDVILLNSQRLITDSLSINQMFLENYSESSPKFISINGFIQVEQSKFIILHNFGSTVVQVSNDKFEILEEKIKAEKPPVSSEFLEGYKLLALGNYTVGYRIDPDKWLKSPDYWVYNWGNGKFARYQDSKFEESSKNTYWDTKNSLEPYSTYSFYTYFIVQTKDGLLFNLPMKNRFVLYSGKTNQMQGFSFPELKKKSQCWYAFYDWGWDRFFSVLDEGNRYSIFSLDINSKSYHKLAELKFQPLGVNDGKVYVRNIEIINKKEGYFIDHHLIDLYPKLK